MADRIHPQDPPAAMAAPPPYKLLALTATPHTDPSADPPSPFSDLSSSTNPPSSTFLIQIPKDQIFRIPSPDHARRFEAYTRHAHRPRRRTCTSCLILTASLLFFILILLAIAAGILYLALRPKTPHYSIDRLAVTGFNLTSSNFDVAVTADNSPNHKIAVSYRHGSSVAILYAGVAISNGVWPSFTQPKRNVTVFHVPLQGSGLRLASALQKSLAVDQQRNAVPLTVDVKVPVRVKFGAVSSWTVTVKVRCDITVDKMTVDSRIVSKTCKTKVHI